MKLKLQTLGRSDGFNKLLSSLISILVGLLVGGLVRISQHSNMEA